jgi:Activator of Hsp90 ATPase homolog 1-like protein
VTPNRHGSAVVEFPDELSVLITREFDAPIALVFDVLTKPEHVRRWGATPPDQMKECSIDLRVGGTYHYVFVTEDGTECSFRRNLPGGRAADPYRGDVAVRRLAGCGGGRDHTAARN